MQQVNNDKKKRLALCEGLKKYSLEKSPMVRYLLDSIREQGCGPKEPQEFIHCMYSDVPFLGKWDYKTNKVEVNAKFTTTQKVFNRTLAHELIHAYDTCRVYLDDTNCAQLACTEIRAANLSSDCSFWNEIKRGNYGLSKQQIKCVKRRTRNSLKPLKACVDCDVDYIMEKVFDRCYADIEPFRTATKVYVD